MSGRSEAFESLVGVTPPISVEEYPEKLLLPEHVHAVSLDALSGTIEDGRERSIHFRHSDEGWRSGRIVRGGRHTANLFHTNLTVFLPPHVYAHTHPNLTSEVLRTTVENSQLEGIDSPEEHEDTIRELVQVVHRVPSPGDVFRTLNSPTGSIGHLLVSSYGSFVWIHRDIKATKSVIRRNALTPKFVKQNNLARKMKRYVEEADVETYGNVSSIESTIEQVVQTRAKALVSDYVCYLNEDPDNPELIKI